MKQKKEITIYDIASELNLSPSTVSRALKDHHSIGKETKKAVVKLAKMRGYRPNSIAASLRSKKTNNIGVVVPWINRPFVSSLISGIEIEAGLKGYNVIISQSHDIFDNEVENAKALYDSRVSGLVVSLAMETTEYNHIQQFIDSNIPVVFVDRVAEDLNSDIVIIDNYAAGYMATEHLIEQGCKRIAHLGGAQHRNIYNEREQGYRQALKDYKLPIDEEIVVHNDVLSHEEGLKCAEYLLNLPIPPDGIFTATLKAPSANAGDINFYFSGLAVNLNGSITGDSHVMGQFTLASETTSSDNNDYTASIGFGLYPNPASEFFMIEGSASEMYYIYNSSGENIKIIPNSGNKIDIGNWMPGLYFIQGRNAKNRITGTAKLVKL